MLETLMGVQYEIKAELTIMHFEDGRTALIDTAVLPLVQRCPWHLDKSGHVTSSKRINGQSQTTKLARMLLSIENCGRDIQADHINNDPTDNRLCNLRKATPHQNSCNRRQPVSSKAPFKGVTRRRTGKWAATIRFSQGGYATAEEAAIAYDCMARRLFGEFASLNFRQSAAESPGGQEKRSTTSLTA